MKARLFLFTAILISFAPQSFCQDKDNFETWNSFLTRKYNLFVGLTPDTKIAGQNLFEVSTSRPNDILEGDKYPFRLWSTVAKGHLRLEKDLIVFRMPLFDGPVWYFTARNWNSLEQSPTAIWFVGIQGGYEPHFWKAEIAANGSGVRYCRNAIRRGQWNPWFCKLDTSRGSRLPTGAWTDIFATIAFRADEATRFEQEWYRGE